MIPSLEIHFWDSLDSLVADHPLVIDRPKGSAHPRYPEVVYPLDYGYLEGTTSIDQGGIDVWVGNDHLAEDTTTTSKLVSAVILTVDLLKNDAELKIALNCDEKDIQTILSFHNRNKMGATAIQRVRK